uniref:Uncharacterized protein n=1 Tax=Rhizophora mucronata TaxID=61149 RepID=A0A2P2LUB1_RHIMU
MYAIYAFLVYMQVSMHLSFLVYLCKHLDSSFDCMLIMLTWIDHSWY